jgi:hypothetical protein
MLIGHENYVIRTFVPSILTYEPTVICVRGGWARRTLKVRHAFLTYLLISWNIRSEPIHTAWFAISSSPLSLTYSLRRRLAINSTLSSSSRERIEYSVVEGMSSSLSSSPSLIEKDGLWVNSDLLLLDCRQEVSILFNVVSPLVCMYVVGRMDRTVFNRTINNSQHFQYKTQPWWMFDALMTMALSMST